MNHTAVATLVAIILVSAAVSQSVYLVGYESADKTRAVAYIAAVNALAGGPSEELDIVSLQRNSTCKRIVAVYSGVRVGAELCMRILSTATTPTNRTIYRVLVFADRAVLTNKGVATPGGLAIYLEEGERVCDVRGLCVCPRGC